MVTFLKQKSEKFIEQSKSCSIPDFGFTKKAFIELYVHLQRRVCTLMNTYDVQLSD